MKLRPIHAQQLVRFLREQGYREVRQRGSHLIMENAAGRLVVVPMHAKEIGLGLLRTIIRETGMTREEFLKKLEMM